MGHSGTIAIKLFGLPRMYALVCTCINPRHVAALLLLLHTAYECSCVL